MSGIKIKNYYPLCNFTIKQAALPKLVVLPLFDGDLVVKVGDKVLTGQVLANGKYFVHSSISGKVVSIADEFIPHKSGLKSRCITIIGDGNDEWIKLEKTQDFRKLSEQKLLEKIKSSGIVGLGGAGFNTTTKLQSLQNCQHIIINATECEPSVEADNVLMQKYSLEIIHGIEILLHLTKAKQAIIAIEDDKEEAFNSLLLSNNNPQIKIIKIKTIYSSGSEKILINNLLNLQIPSGEFATDNHILMQNVATVRAIFNCIIDGKPLIERVVTISGDKEKPHNEMLRVGTKINKIVNGNNLRLNGLMMGIDLSNGDYPILKTTSAIFNNNIVKKAPAQECIRCGECVSVCPIGLLPQQLYWFAKSDNIPKMQDYSIKDCIECRCCDVVCGSNIPLSEYFIYGKAKLREHKKQNEDALLSKKRFEYREYRLERNKQEKSAMMARKRAEIKQKLAKNNENSSS